MTGAEIYSFFARFGANSIFGLACFFVLFFALTYKILTKNPYTENDLNLQNFDKIKAKNTVLQKYQAKRILIFFNILMIASAMFSGLKNVVFQLFFCNQILIFLGCVFFVFLCLLFGIKWLTKINGVLILFLIFVVLCMIFGMKNHQNFAFAKCNFTANNQLSFCFQNITLSMFFACIYVFMNIVEIEPVVNEFHFVFDKRKAKIFSFFYALVLVLLLGIFCLFFERFEFLTSNSMPMLMFFKMQGELKVFVFSVGLVLCLLTTLISCLLGLKRTLVSKKLSNLSASFLAVFVSMVIGMVPFSVFVNVVYPIIGIVNFAIFVLL